LADDHESVDLASRLTLRPPEAARALGVSERKLRTMLPLLPHLRAGGVVLIPIDALREWIADRVRDRTIPTVQSPTTATKGEAVAKGILEQLKRAD